MQDEGKEERDPIPRECWLQDWSNQLPSLHSPTSPLPWNKLLNEEGCDMEYFTGNNSVSKCCNLLCWPNRPLKRNTFSHLKSGYLSWSPSTNSTLRSVDGAPMFFRSARVIEYQSDACNKIQPKLIESTCDKWEGILPVEFPSVVPPW